MLEHPVARERDADDRVIEDRLVLRSPPIERASPRV